MIKSLTQKWIERHKWNPSEGVFERYFDPSFPNLMLKIGKRSKTFYWNGRTVAGKQIAVKLGCFPLMNLSEAKESCREVTKKVTNGGDPRRRQVENMNGEDLVNSLTSFATWKTDRGEDRANTLEGYLRRGFVPICGDMNIKDIHSGHLLDVLEIYLREGKSGAAIHMYNSMLLLWKFALVCRFVDVNPMFGIDKPKANAPRDRVLSDDDLRHIWHKLGSETTYRQPVEHAIAIQLLMLLPFRGMELIHGEWKEIDFEKAIWTIPSNRIKTRSDGRGSFVMPLPPTALQVLENLFESTGTSQYLFPAPRAGQGPINVRVIGRFISRNREKGIFEDMEKWSKHDLRRTIATNMGMLGVDDSIIGRCLNHSQSGVTNRVYNLHSYTDKKLEALIQWEDHLMSVVESD